ncbi:MAG: hypothetical protein Kow0047_01680 [Anaerolineae bacterium]
MSDQPTPRNGQHEGSDPSITILIVDDHQVLRTALRKWLSLYFPECRYLEATTGEEALELAARERPSIVLMDIGLPGMSGIEATLRIREISPTSHVIIVTIHEEPEYEEDALAAGATAYVSKFQMGFELIPLLQRLLGDSADVR